MNFLQPLQLKAYDELKGMIIRGELQPKTIYSETKLSQSLGISRTPFRDAIHRLTHEGYLDVLPSKGFQIHEMNARDLLETYQIRCALEGFCIVQLAKDYDTPSAKALFSELDELIVRQADIISTTHSACEFAEYDVEFHKKILYHLDNSLMQDAFETYLYQMSKQISLSLESPGRLEETIAEHIEILDFMKMGAVGRSYKSILNHLENPKVLIHLEE